MDETDRPNQIFISFVKFEWDIHRKEAVSRNYGDVGLRVKKCLNREKNNEGQLASDSRGCRCRERMSELASCATAKQRGEVTCAEEKLTSLELFLL